jgi:hypothetical protein
MVNTIGIVGVGSLGGYIAKSMQRFADKIYGVDPDTVEERNLRNSLYNKTDIDKPKVMALKQHITECDYVPVQDDIREVESLKFNHLIDCRDVVNKNIKSDSKFMVVGKNLQINCSELVEDDDIEGDYMIDLGKDDVSQAGRLAAVSLLSGGISSLQKKKMSVNIPLSTKSLIKEIDFLVKQANYPEEKRDMGLHLQEEIKSISNSRGHVKTKLCKVDDFQGIAFCEPQIMSYSQVINLLNDVVLRQGGTYMIDHTYRYIEICNPFLSGGA